MNSERAAAYGRAMKTLADLGPTKFHPSQQDVIREAADSLLFCEDIASDDQALEALARFHELTRLLFENDTLVAATIERLLEDVEGCGPLFEPAAEPVGV